MICEDIQEELVAYCDGELPEEDRAQIAAHLSTCSACSRDVAQYTRVNTLLMEQVERISPSPDFAATFWQRLEQEKRTLPAQESRQKPRLSCDPEPQGWTQRYYGCL